MALVVKDRVKESASNPGTGTVTLSGAVAGFRSFGDIGSGNTTYYVIFDVANSLFEVGEGTYTDNTGGGGNRELARNEVLQNSSGNTSKINFTGSVEVFVALPASKSVHKNNTDNLELTGDFTITSGSATDQIVMKNTNTGTSAAPDLVLWRDSASPANADSLGRIDFRGEDDGSTARNYTSIESKIVNVAASTPTGAIHFKTLNASTTEADVLVLSGNTSTFSGNVDVSGDVSVTSGTNARLSINDAIGEVGSGNLALQVGNSAQNALKPMGFRAEKFIFADGNLGIGTTSPASLLTINGDGTTVRLDGSGNTTRTIFFRSTTTSNPAQIYADGSLRLRTEDASTAIIFNTNSSGTNNEAMRIDGSQNLMVGRTSLGISNTGHTLAAAGYVEFTRDGAAALNVGRNSSFGETAVFWKDGTQQGSIASESGYLKVIGGNGSSVGSGLLFTNTVIAPRSHTGASTNGTIDLGYNTERFKDLYLGGTCNVGNDIYASSDIFLKGDSSSFNTTYTASGYGTPLSITSATGYVGATFIGTGSYSNVWQLYFSGTGTNKFAGIYDRTSSYYVCEFYKDGRVQLGNNRFYMDASGNVDIQGNITYSANNHILATNNSRNLQFVSGGSGSDVGLFLKDAGSTASVQLYGTASYHGFLDSAWGSWDLKKQKGSALYLNNNTTYYLNPAATSHMNTVDVDLLKAGGSSGSSGQVLTSNGSSTPTWQDAGGSEWETVTDVQLTSGNDTYLDITVTRGYYYRIWISDHLVNNTGGARKFEILFHNYTYGWQRNESNAYLLCAGYSEWTAVNTSNYYPNAYGQQNSDTSYGSYGWIARGECGTKGSNSADFGYMEWYQGDSQVIHGSSNNYCRFNFNTYNYYVQNWGYTTPVVSGTSGSLTDSSFINKIRFRNVWGNGFWGNFRVTRLKVS